MKSFSLDLMHLIFCKDYLLIVIYEDILIVICDFQRDVSIRNKYHDTNR